MNLPETCPFCGAGVHVMEDGTEDRSCDYVRFVCHTYIQLHIKDPCNQSPTCKNITRVAELEAHIKTITEGCARENLNIEQICGEALGYPRYCDDQENFPGATEEDGVCVGEHVAASIASELAGKYRDLLARNKRLEEALSNVELVMQRPASNHRMMQIAEPARRVLNIIKQVKDSKQ